MPAISCIVTSFNNLPWLREALDSLFAQTRQPDEILVADDGSTDGSRDYLASLARERPTVRVILRERNLGVAANRDLAVRAATGDLVTTLDGDDVFYPGKLAAELAAIGDRALAIAFSDVDRIDDAGEVLQRLVHDGFSGLDRTERIRYLLFRKGPVPRDMLYPRSLFEEAGGFRHELGMYEDWDLKMRIAAIADAWCHTGEPGVGYRQHGRGLSAADGLTHLSWRLNVITGNRAMLADTVGIEDIYNALLMHIAHSVGYSGARLVR